MDNKSLHEIIEETIENVMEQMYDKFCKYPERFDDDEILCAFCERNCPLMRL